MTTRLERLKEGLVCLVPKDGKDGITCHEKTICDCTALRMIELLERAKPFVEHVMSGPSHIWLKDLEEL